MRRKRQGKPPQMNCKIIWRSFLRCPRTQLLLVWQRRLPNDFQTNASLRLVECNAN